MSKTTKDKYHRNEDRKFTDGYKKPSADYYSNKKEKRERNQFRSNNMNEIFYKYYS